MHSDSIRLSIAILRAVIAGNTYESVASAYGWTHTAIENRVRRLAKSLHREVGIEGINSEAAGYVQRLRAHKDDVEAALARFEIGDFRPQARPKALIDTDVWSMLRRAGRHSPTPLRDMALIHIVLATGARPLEIARLQIRDYLNPEGSVRGHSEMRAEVSVNRIARPLFFRSSAAMRAIDAYLEHRLPQQDAKPQIDEPYRGLNPSDRLFLNDASQPYMVHRIDAEGRSRFLCRQMHETYRKIFNRIGMHGVSALTLRRTVAFRLNARGADEKQIGLILGITDKKAVRKLLPSRPDMAELMTDLHPEANIAVAVMSAI